MTRGHALEALDIAMDASRQANTGLMIHISSQAPTNEILKRLRPGDIVTHCFQGRGDGLFKNNRELLPEAIDARRRGVIFDVGHGGGSFSSGDVARKDSKVSFGLTPSARTCIAFASNVGPRLSTTMSKFLHLGMSLEDVILKTTWAPARAIGRSDLGSLKKGCIADILVFSVEEGEFEYEDTHLQIEKARKKLTPHLVFRKGKPIEPGAYPIRLRPFLPCDREVLDFVEKMK